MHCKVFFFNFIYQHGKRSGFRNLQYNDENANDNEDTYLLQVRGVSKYDTKAVQVNMFLFNHTYN